MLLQVNAQIVGSQQQHWVAVVNTYAAALMQHSDQMQQ